MPSVSSLLSAGPGMAQQAVQLLLLAASFAINAHAAVRSDLPQHISSVMPTRNNINGSTSEHVEGSDEHTPRVL